MPLEANLSPDVHLAVAHQDLLVLEIGADRYHCLPNAARAVACGPGGRVTFHTPSALRLFQSAGFLAKTIAGERLDPPPPRPLRRYDDDTLVRRDRKDALRLALAVGDLGVHYRGRTFKQILDHAARGRLDREPTITDHLRERVAQFHSAVIWAPIPRKCLARSFLLLSFLRRWGLDARWVIAARAWPFAAHCWLQVEDMVLDDDPERLAVYSPICMI